MSILIKWLTYGFSIILFSSCATIFSGTSQFVAVDSKPQGADIIFDGQIVGTTPTTFLVQRRSQDLTIYGRPIRLEKDGYETENHFLRSKLNAVAVLNLFNLIFWGIDYLTGAIVRYDSYNLYPLREKETRAPVNLNKTPSNNHTDYERLRELKKLLDEGILTEEEFKREKDKILNANQ